MFVDPHPSTAPAHGPRKPLPTPAPSNVSDEQQHAADPSVPCDEYRFTILAVDDEPDALDFLRAFLAEEFDFMQAASGPQALALIAERRPDLLIVDFMMPGMNGLELCEELRRRDDTRSIPILLYSARDLKKRPDLGLYDLAVVKPADPDELLCAIRALLDPPS